MVAAAGKAVMAVMAAVVAMVVTAAPAGLGDLGPLGAQAGIRLANLLEGSGGDPLMDPPMGIVCPIWEQAGRARADAKRWGLEVMRWVEG